MIRRTLPLVLSAVLVAACSDDGGVRLAKLDEMRVVKVSGDQASRVPSPPQNLVAIAAALDPDGYTAEPLVGRVVVDGVASRGGGAVVPPGTLVHWDIPADAGRLLAGSTATDDSAYIVNRWAPGTRAGTYRVRAQRILADGSIVTDTSWEVVVEPGRAVSVYFENAPYRPLIGSTFDLREYVTSGEDAHRNTVSAAVILATPEAQVSWRWADRRHGGPATDVPGAGWTVTVPDFRDLGYLCVDNTERWCAARLYVTIGGAEGFAGQDATWIDDSH